ncbi:hypothetical protein KTR10_01005 [Candidatus Kaiserbacteria bacterium]|nr:hypothetical protein [Candidatus Kaiserbacteria bacterium]
MFTRYTQYLSSVLVGLFLFVGVTHAQEEELTLVADVAIENAGVVYQEDEVAELFFEFVNGASYQPDVHYGIQVLSLDEPGVLVDEYVVSETTVLEPGERQSHYISYQVPKWLDGEYQVLVVSFNSEGYPLALAPIAETIAFEGTGEYLEIVPNSCEFLIEGALTPADTPVVVMEGQEASFHCTVVSHFDESVFASPVTFVFRDSTFSLGVGAFPEERPVSFEPDEEKEIFFSVPMQDKGVFEHQVFFESEGEIVSNPVFYAYNTEMPRAQIINLTTDKGSYEPGDEAVVHTFVQGSAIASVRVDISSQNGRSCTQEPLKQVASEEQIQITTMGEISRDCENVVVTATIFDADGTTLDARMAGEPSVGTRDTLVLKILGSIILLIILILAIYFVSGRKGKKAVVTSTLFLGVLFAGGMIGVESVEAKTWSGSKTGTSCNYRVEGSINKSTYDVDDTIRATGSSMVWCTGNGAHGGGLVSTNISTSGDSATAASGGQTVTLNAPNSNGSYSVRFRDGAYNKGGNLSYTVTGATPPAPTANLSASPTSITKGDNTRLTWSSTNANGCSGSGSGFSTGNRTSGGDNASPTSDTRYTVTCTGGGGSDSDSVDVSVSEPTPTASISASPRTVVRGAQTRLTWSSSNAEYCTGVRFGTGRRTSGSTYVTVNSDTDYGIRCYNSDGDLKIAVVSVSVTDPAPSVSLSVSPSNITEGGSATVTWSSTNASSCSGSGSGFSTGNRTSGSDGVSPSSTTTYSITCTGPGGNDSDTARLTVNAPAPSVNLSASPSSITRGNSSTLTWSSSNTSTCAGSGSGFSTGGNTSGSDSVSPSSTTTYSITCTGEGGSDSDTQQVTVNAQSPSASISISPSSITEGGSATVTWSSTNASSCSGNGSGFSTGGSTSGSDSVSPSSTTTYTVTCTGAGGSDSDSDTLTVNTPAPSASLEVRNVTQGGGWTGSNIIILPGDQVYLRWDSDDATSCNGSNFSTGGDTDGTQTSVSEPSAGNQTVFSVSCSGSGGSDSDSLRVTAQATDPSLSADSTNVREGETITFSYDMEGNDPSQCTLTGPGISYLAGSFSNQTGTVETTVSGDSTFILDCDGGSAEVSIDIIPISFDS